MAHRGLRPCLEDALGAGAIVAAMQRTSSPEARAAAAAFSDAKAELFERLATSAEGAIKIATGQRRDVELAAALDISDCVPHLVDGVYRRWTATP